MLILCFNSELGGKKRKISPGNTVITEITKFDDKLLEGKNNVWLTMHTSLNGFFWLGLLKKLCG